MVRVEGAELPSSRRLTITVISLVVLALAAVALFFTQSYYPSKLFRPQSNRFSIVYEVYVYRNPYGWKYADARIETYGLNYNLVALPVRQVQLQTHGLDPHSYTLPKEVYDPDDARYEPIPVLRTFSRMTERRFPDTVYIDALMASILSSVWLTCHKKITLSGRIG